MTNVDVTFALDPVHDDDIWQFLRSFPEVERELAIKAAIRQTMVGDAPEVDEIAQKLDDIDIQMRKLVGAISDLKRGGIAIEKKETVEGEIAPEVVAAFDQHLT